MSALLKILTKLGNGVEQPDVFGGGRSDYLDPRMAGSGPALLTRGTPSAMPARNPNQTVLPSMGEMEGNRDRYLDEAFAPAPKAEAPFSLKGDVLPTAGLAILAKIFGAKNWDIGAGVTGYATGKASRYKEMRDQQQADQENRARRALASAGIETERIAARNRYVEKTADSDERKQEQILARMQAVSDREDQQSFAANMAAENDARDAETSGLKQRTAALNKFVDTQITSLKDKDMPPERRARLIQLLELKRHGQTTYVDDQEINLGLGTQTYQGANIENQIKARNMLTKYRQAEYDLFVKMAPDEARKLTKEIDRILGQTALTATQREVLMAKSLGVGTKRALQLAAVLASTKQDGATPAELKSLLTILEAERGEILTKLAQNPAIVASEPGLIEEKNRLDQDIAAYNAQLKALLKGKAGGGAPGGGGGRPGGGRPPVFDDTAPPPGGWPDGSKPADISDAFANPRGAGGAPAAGANIGGMGSMAGTAKPKAAGSGGNPAKMQARYDALVKIASSGRVWTPAEKAEFVDLSAKLRDGGKKGGGVPKGWASGGAK